MDVILLPREALGTEVETSTSDDHRLTAIEVHLAALARAGEPLRLFGYLPACDMRGQSELLRFLIQSEQQFACTSTLVVRRQQLGSGILEHPYLGVLDRVVLDLEDLPVALSDTEVSVIERYQMSVTETNQRITVWTEPAQSPSAHARLLPLLNRCGAGLDLACPDFKMPCAADAKAIVEEPQGGTPTRTSFCRLQENVLTIDANGDVVACPRHRDNPESIDLGNVADVEVEPILARIGYLSLLVGELETCRGCQLNGRFFWPEGRGEHVLDMMISGSTEAELTAVGQSHPDSLWQRDFNQLSTDGMEAVMVEFESRLQAWKEQRSGTSEEGPFISVETPVIKAGWLIPCILSVLEQSSPRWRFSLLWDQGDEAARLILERLEKLEHPCIQVFFSSGLGVARARRFITERSAGEYILPLDDDDTLAPNAVERLLQAADERPWGGMLRARRGFIDESGTEVEMDDWFPFSPRSYFRGMTQDLYNHAQPYLIAREAYDQTAGWAGFEEYKYAGEDCDIFAKIEEVSDVELIDDVLYYYRLSSTRTSHSLGHEAAEDMWRRLALVALERRGLPLSLESEKQPYVFTSHRPEPVSMSSVGFLVLVPEDTVISKGSSSDGQRRRTLERGLEALGIDGDAIHFLGEPSTSSHQTWRWHMGESINALCVLDLNVELPTRESFDLLLDALNEDGIEMVAPKVVSDGGEVLAADPYFDTALLPRVRGAGEPDTKQYDYDSSPAWLSGRLLVVRSEVVRSIGGFDPMFAGDLRDADFCLRARRRGFGCRYVGATSVVLREHHRASHTSKQEKRFSSRWSEYPDLLFPAEETVGTHSGS